VACIAQSKGLYAHRAAGGDCRYRIVDWATNAVAAAREKFKAMKYFHMGHRLEEVVKREKELARR